MDLSTISGCFTCMFDGATVFPCTFVPQQNNLMGSWLLLSGWHGQSSVYGEESRWKQGNGDCNHSLTRWFAGHDSDQTK
jgi:hypothetical protein